MKSLFSLVFGLAGAVIIYLIFLVLGSASCQTSFFMGC